jgi:hypothetical protein
MNIEFFSKCLSGREYIEAFLLRYDPSINSTLPKAVPQIVEDVDTTPIEDGHEDVVETLEPKRKTPNTTNYGIVYDSTVECSLLNKHVQLVDKDTIINSDIIYATSMPNLVCNSTKPLVFSFPGGFVFPVQETFFRSQDDIELNVVDFQSLYPTMMCRYNICPTNAAYHPDFMVQLSDGTLVDPLLSDEVEIFAVPLKVSGHMLNVVCFTIINVDSVTKSFITKFNRMRQQAKTEMRGCIKTSSQYDRLNARQLSLKLVVNSMYGLYNSANHSSYRPVLGALVTYMGRMALTRLEIYKLFEKYINKVDNTIVLLPKDVKRSKTTTNRRRLSSNVENTS